MRLSNGQILRSDASALAAMVRCSPTKNSREALELAERIKVLNIALQPAALNADEMSAADLRKVIKKALSVLDSTRGPT